MERCATHFIVMREIFGSFVNFLPDFFDNLGTVTYRLGRYESHAKPARDGHPTRGDQFSIRERCCIMLSQIKNFVVDFVAREDGPTAVEYAVMLALIIVVCLAAITTLGQNANTTFTTVGSKIGSASS